jgi:hypothetical protein
MAPVSEPGRIDLGPEDTELEGESEYCVVNTCEAGGLEAEVEVEASELACPVVVSLQSQEAQTLTLTQTLTCERHEGAVDPGPDIPLKSLVVRVGGRAGSSVRGLIEADTACLVRWIGSMILAEATMQTQTQRQREALALIQEPSVHSPFSPPTVSAVLGDPTTSSSPPSSSSPSYVQDVKSHKVGDGLCDVDPDPHSPSASSAADTVAGGRADTHASPPAPTPTTADSEAVSRKEGREKWRESQGGRGGDRAMVIQQQRLERLEGSRCWCALQQGTRESCLAAIRSMRYQTDPSASSSSTSTAISVPPFGFDSDIDHSDKDIERYTQRQRDKGRNSSTSDSSSSRKKDRDIDHRSNSRSSSSSSSSSNSNGSTSTGPVGVGGGGGVVPLGESERSDPVADLSHRLLSLLSADTHTHCKSFKAYLPGPWTCTCTSGPGPACAGCNGSRGVGEGPRDGDKGQKYRDEAEDKEFEVEVEVEEEVSSSVRSIDCTIERDKKSERKSAAELLISSLQQYGVGDSDGDGDGEFLDRDRVPGMISCLRSHIRVCTVPHCFVLC